LNYIKEFYDRYIIDNFAKDEYLFEYVITNDINNYKKILSKSKKMDSIKIFYRLGLDDHEDDEEQKKYVFKFNLDKKVIKKMSYLIKFIDHFLDCFKN